ncbi:MAG TPA: glycosyltransferase family 39 protein [Candidatus Acidoferrales bacterium]|nr:glycosyltransferase family 39 protein [Candidatus Acidoferrales bacterium]
MSERRPESQQRPPLARGTLALVALALFALHATAFTAYGWFRDELYYVSCARRLAWGYVDQPPLSIAVLAIVRAIAGDRLLVIRVAATLVAIAFAMLAGALARELGGRRFAQGLAALAAGLAPVSLGIGHYWSMNVFDQLFWVLASLLAVRALATGRIVAWLALGLALGLGLLDKWSVLWLGAGLGVAIVLSPQRRVLRSRGPWLAVALALAIVVPHALWERAHGWPTLEFMRNARTQKMLALEPLKFLLGQMLAAGPGAAPVWLAGLGAALVPARATWRPLAIVYLVTLAILLASGSARAEYLTLAVPGLLAAGAVWWEARPAAARASVSALLVALALPLAPFAMPCLPVPAFLAWQRALRLAPQTEEHHRMGALPQHYADMFGWPEMADSVARVAATLPDSERARAITVADNYGEAGALELFGAGRVPNVCCQHNNWFLWGPPPWDGSTAILLGRDSSEAAREFRQVIVAGRAGHPLAMPYEQDLPILVARGFKADLAVAWAQGRHYQ